MPLFFWIVNGFLVILYMLADNLLGLVLLALLIPFVLTVPDFLRTSSFIVAGLAVAAALFTPMPVPFFLALMAGAAWIVRKFEKFNRIDAQWIPIRNLGTYAVMGLAYWAFKTFGADLAPANDDATLAQGWVYLNFLVGAAIYLTPFGFLGWAIKDLLAHPGIPGSSPEGLAGSIRTAGRGR